MREGQLHAALEGAKRAEQLSPRENRKRKPKQALARYLAVPPNGENAIRDADLYRAKTYNLARQVLSLIDHLFVRYPVPLFLYRSVLSVEGLALVFDESSPKEKPSPYREWFFTAAQGGSLAKLARQVFTKREAHWFLLAPNRNTIEQNIRWAKAAAQGAPAPCCDYLVERISEQDWKRLGDRTPDLLRFYAGAWAEMRGHDADEITDFVRAMIRNRQFSFKGRTFGSMRKLCHEWQRFAHPSHLREFRSWDPAYPQWERREKGVTVRAIELTNNRALADEGQKQRHCVYNYTAMCLQGRSRIVSVRWYEVSDRPEEPMRELKRVTLEVSPSNRQVVQIRRRKNRKATEEESQLVRQWAEDQGLTISPYA